MKGIILAGGSGTRLYPITKGISKQLVPIYDKPMIYYPIATLMQAGIKDILIITTKEEQSSFIRLLGNGSQFGVHFDYIIQPSPDGLAQAFILGEKFIGLDSCAMVLGDNIYFGDSFEEKLKKAKDNADKGFATIFGYKVKDPNRFGIMELDSSKQFVISVEEKPEKPKSDYAITGLYFYPAGVSDKAKKVVPSSRGELEITSLNDMYLKENLLKAELLGSGYTWYDTGTHRSMMEAANMIMAIENNNGSLICAPEIVAYDNNWIDNEELIAAGNLMKKNEYGQSILTYALKNKK